jgi:L-lactate dehydrogenase
MEIKSRKVAVIGVGNVGSHVAFSLVTRGIADELVLIDIKEDKVKSEMLDLEDSLANLNSNVKIKIQDYSELKDAEIAVISAGPLPRFEQSRLDTLDDGIKIIDDIMPKILKSGFQGIFLVITNPCDVITHYVLKKSGFPKNRVIGTGTSLDSARFKRITGDLLGIDPKSILGYSLGEHGDSQMIPWSHIYVGGKPFMQYIKSKDNFKEIDTEKILKDTSYAGWEVLLGKGATCFGIGSAASTLIKSVFNNEHKVYPVSVFLDGEYGLEDVCLSIPAILGNKGVEEIIELGLPEDEYRQLTKSAEVIKTYIEKIKS